MKTANSNQFYINDLDLLEMTDYALDNGEFEVVEEIETNNTDIYFD